MSSIFQKPKFSLNSMLPTDHNSKMVFFICDECGETMKKKQVLQHNHRCHTARYSCMDCQTVFDRDSYQTHVKCITEDQKYGGVNHVRKEKRRHWWSTPAKVLLVATAVLACDVGELRGIFASPRARHRVNNNIKDDNERSRTEEDVSVAERTEEDVSVTEHTEEDVSVTERMSERKTMRN